MFLATNQTEFTKKEKNIFTKSRKKKLSRFKSLSLVLGYLSRKADI